MGSDPDALMVASLDSVGYLTYGMADPGVWTDLGWSPVPAPDSDSSSPNFKLKSGSAPPVLPGVSTFVRRQAWDKQQVVDLRPARPGHRDHDEGPGSHRPGQGDRPSFFRIGVSPPTANVVVSLDIAQHVACSDLALSHGAGSDGALTAIFFVLLQSREKVPGFFVTDPQVLLGGYQCARRTQQILLSGAQGGLFGPLWLEDPVLWCFLLQPQVLSCVFVCVCVYVCVLHVLWNLDAYEEMDMDVVRCRLRVVRFRSTLHVHVCVFRYHGAACMFLCA